MNLFIGSSSYNDIDKHYLENAQDLIEKLAQIPNLNLVIGAAQTNCGIIDISYHEFKKKNKKVISITLKDYHNSNDLEVDETIEVETTMDRIKLIYQNSNFILFLPGGLGTHSELLAVLSEKIEKNDNKTVVIYNKDFFYTPIIKELYSLYENKFIKKNISDYCIIESDPEKIRDLIVKENM